MSSEPVRGTRLLVFVVAATVLLAPAVAPGSPGPQERRQGEGTQDPVFYPDDPLWFDPDDTHIEKPEEQQVGIALHALKTTVAGVDVEDRGAMNINTLGEVPNSSWFTNRHGRREMSLAELLRGPDRGGPPAAGVWRVVGHPGEGHTAKLTIEDENGRRFLIKFDAPDNAGMNSATEVVCTKFFYALGYHVPENYIVVFDPEELVGDPDLDPGEFPAQDIEQMLADVSRTPDGQIRAMASSWLGGEPVGPFKDTGTRVDDPNDVFPHQHRRELRGLRVFAAWLHHSDIKPDNTLDMYVEEDGRGYLRHHLIDFGNCMGSSASGPKERYVGYERYFNAGGLLKGVFTFGLWSVPAARVEFPDYPAVGHFEGDFYQPWLFKPPVANAGFQNMDAADAFWAARIVTAFNDQDVGELVAEGRYGDPEQEEYVVATLIQRRDKTVAYWLTRTNPLDDFRVDAGRLTWDNAAVREGVAAPDAAYAVRWLRLDNDSGERTPLAATPGAGQAELGDAAAELPADPWGPADRFGLRYAVAEISTRHPEFPHWGRPVVVTLRLTTDGGAEVVGVEHPREMPPEPDS